MQSNSEDFNRIIELTMTQFVMDHDDSMHGIAHWQEVEKNAIMLAVQPNVDMTVVRLFAYFHDCKRVEEYEDYEHGERAAEFVKECRYSGKLDFINGNQYNLLWEACNSHNKGIISEDPTIGACFDADRIELMRCRIIPRPELMSTPIGKRMAEKFQFLAGKCLNIY